MSYFTRILAACRRTFGKLPTQILLTATTLFALTPTSESHAQQPVAEPAPAATPVQAQPQVQAIPSMRDRVVTLDPVAKASPPRKKQYDLDVTSQQWLDTGLVVSGGEALAITAAGSLSLPDGRVSTPDGLDRGWKDLLRQFPLNQAKTGALVGRVSDMGASTPFLIGAKSSVVMPTSGHLYLRANVSDDLVGTGSFNVTIKPDVTVRSQDKASTDVSVTPSPALTSLLSPALFTKIPRRVGDENSAPGDMVNFALIGTEAQIKAAFKSAGWVAVDKSTQDAVLHGLLSTLNHEAYVEMPMSTLYLFGRPQDLSFARADPLTVAAERHHLRVWKSPETIAGQPLWVGSATHDIGFERDQRNGKATHKIDPEIDAERTFLLNSFDAAGAFSAAAYVTPETPLREAKTATGGSFFSDGRIVVMNLKPGLQ